MPEVFKRVAAYNIPAEKIDGMDVLKVHNATKQALDRIRRGGGPQFIECETYRYRGHSMADPGAYRPAVELKAHQNWDPIAAAIRNVELKYPTPDELAEVGPDNIKLFADHLIDGEHLAEAESRTSEKKSSRSWTMPSRSPRKARNPPWMRHGAISTVTSATKC